ncbi:MAG: tRNA uridine(34) 5-carboxymethylaminomethyl modification radical SAM/GNAT enzyme Elp3 [Anaerolineaceae bacterium]|nr:tRNA uridine(34) 5-carboxymethylaminomethyl modification radical SAM/GNAT enzyme Elp3 [Anaerolineaceae bacterium]
MKDMQTWLKQHELTPEKLDLAHHILDEIRQGAGVLEAIRANPVPGSGHLGKHALVAVYRRMVEDGEMAPDPALLERIRMKPMRTLSGVTTVTVLTKPYPCPGKCIFCPTDWRMPKSYLPDEPGAARALQNEFDPYLQVRSRIDSLEAVGHPTDKIELLILGGTWSSYRHDYQEWFIRRCFDAMNECDTPTLAAAQAYNETGPHRNVGLVIETRPDKITLAELAWLRRLGVTKVQLGVQSLDDSILALNQRGHDSARTLQAAALLRAAGFKIVMHWMPNLLGATPESDRRDFARLWQPAQDGLGYCPDEIKIYPNQLLENAELYQYWQRGEFRPYTTDELVDLIADVKPGIPEYCRVNRVIRDIPSTNVVAGNKRTSLRQDVLAELGRRGRRCRCVRCREVRGHPVRVDELRLEDYIYHPACAEEHFLSFVTADDRLAGYLRLSLPGRVESCDEQAQAPLLDFLDLEGAALIREVHVYGQSLAVGAEKAGAAQHAGLGTRLLQEAEELARRHGFRRLAVIAAVGTRCYYESRGFQRGQLYMLKAL